LQEVEVVVKMHQHHQLLLVAKVEVVMEEVMQETVVPVVQTLEVVEVVLETTHQVLQQEVMEDQDL
jgi:hypothetical protein